MKTDTLLDAIGMIRDEYVQDAKAVRVVKKNHPWLKWSAMAACACVLVYIGLQSGFGGSEESAATNCGPQLENTANGIAQNSSSKNEAAADSDAYEFATDDRSDEAESAEGNQSSYPYNDKYVLDYAGMPLADMETKGGIIVFNEIENMDMYRALNNLLAEESKVYYDTTNGLYQYLSVQEDTQYFKDRAEEGLVPGNTGNEAYLEACASSDKYADWTDIASYLLSENCLDGFVEGAISDSLEIVALKSYVADGPNGQVTILAGKDLDALGAEVQVFVEPMREALKTEQSSMIFEQQVMVQYFYQQRMLREETPEECYQYYAYFEKDDVEFLYQYSSNWTIPGADVTAIHKPPHTISEAISQEESREMFGKILSDIVECLE